MSAKWPRVLLEDEDGAPFPDEVQDAYQAQVIDYQIQLATLQDDLAEAVALLKRLEQAKMDGYKYGACAICLYPYHSHAPDCALDAFLRRHPTP